MHESHKRAPPASTVTARPTGRAALEEQWQQLDDELARSLVARAILRARKNRPGSPCDAVALALRRARTALCSVAYGLLDAEALARASSRQSIAPAYLWSIRIAHELEAIEHAELSADGDWSRLERFAPFALASHATHAAMFDGPQASEIEEALAAAVRIFDQARASSAAAA